MKPLTAWCIAAFAACFLTNGHEPPDAWATEGDPSLAYEPVLNLVRDYTGPRDGSSLGALFSSPPDRTVRQLPPIALSDGRTAVIIAAKISPKEGKAVNFSLQGAKILTMNKIRGDEWQIKAMPVKGATAMAMEIVQGEQKTVYPLVVSPPVPEETDLSAHGFHEFFEKVGNRLDLNADGRKDYLDDYIFLANYLTRQTATGRDLNARKQRALQRSLTIVPPAPKPEFNPADFPD